MLPLLAPHLPAADAFEAWENYAAAACVLVPVFWPGLLNRRWERHVESALTNIRYRASLGLDPELLEEMANVTALYPEWKQR